MLRVEVDAEVKVLALVGDIVLDALLELVMSEDGDNDTSELDLVVVVYSGSVPVVEVLMVCPDDVWLCVNMIPPLDVSLPLAEVINLVCEPYVDVEWVVLRTCDVCAAPSVHSCQF